MKDLSSVASDLSRGKDFNNNLDKYIRGMSSMYNGLAYIKLSMNYYTVYDMNKEQGSNADQLYIIMLSEGFWINRCQFQTLSSSDRKLSVPWMLLLPLLTD